jgi:amino acid transporter
LRHSKVEFIYYCSVGVGLALSTSSFLLIALLFRLGDVGAVILAVVGAAILCGLVALAAGEMARTYPSGAGIRTFSRQAFGETVSLFVTFTYLSVLFLVAGLESCLLSTLLQITFPSVPTFLWLAIIFAGVIALNIRGVKLSAPVQIIATSILVVGMLLFGALGWWQPQRLDFVDAFDSSSFLSVSLLASIGTAVFLFVGFEWITPLGINRAAYQLKIPYAMCTAIVINCFAYLAFILGFAVLVPRGDVADGSLAHLLYFVEMVGPQGALIALGFSLIAIFTTFNAGIMGGAQILYVLAREQRLPKVLTGINGRWGTPVNAILALGLMAGLCAAIAIVFDAAALFMLTSSILFCLAYICITLSATRLRAMQKTLAGESFKLPTSLLYGAALVMTVIAAASLWELLSNDPKGGVLILFIFVVAAILTAIFGDGRHPFRVNAAVPDPQGEQA